MPRPGNFEAFFNDRQARLLTLITDAMGKAAVRDTADGGAEFEEQDDDPPEVDDGSEPVH